MGYGHAENLPRCRCGRQAYVNEEGRVLCARCWMVETDG